MFHIIYKTTDIRNGKIYVGKHSTKNLDDGYVGSGSIIRSIKKKHGFGVLKTEVLMFCDSKDEMDDIERILVDEHFVTRPDVYNLALGGKGGFIAGSIEAKEAAIKSGKARLGRTKDTHDYIRRSAEKLSEKLKGRLISDASNRRKITQAETFDIVRRFSNGETRESIMIDFAAKISIVTLNKILRNSNYGGSKELSKRKPKVSEEEISLMKSLHADGNSIRSIHRRFQDKVSFSTVRKILTTT